MGNRTLPILLVFSTVASGVTVGEDSFPFHSLTRSSAIFSPEGEEDVGSNDASDAQNSTGSFQVQTVALANSLRMTRSTPESSSSSNSVRLVDYQNLDSANDNTNPVQPGDSGYNSSPYVDANGWHPLDTLTLFGGLEGSKQPQDFGVNANFGSRWAANWGFPLLAEYGIGAQIGTSINQTDDAVQVFQRVGATMSRTQNFSTVGVFQRYGRWRWGAGYDFLYERYYDNFFLGQWRGRGGYAITDVDEVGIWCAIAQKNSSGYFENISVTLSPITQGSVYWQHTFAMGSRTMIWAGVSEGHAQANLALGDLKRTGDQFVFGAEIDVPLNPYLAIYGQANFISPANTGTVDSYLGVAYWPSGHAIPATRNPFTPLLALANSTMFAADLTR